ncbi:MAG TPA: hypothetical protein VJR48_18175 [Ktedonobacterales bacterium]|nr:hypothetical protein [Ktedonobacterales bacterium]
MPSPKAEPFKQWLARVGAQRLEELDNPQVAADSLRLLYRQRGYDDEWIELRLRGIVVRDDLTTEWRDRGAEEGREFAILTEILHRGAFEVTTDQHRQIKQLKQRENLRDNMTSLELALTMLSEATATGDAPGTRFTGVRRATTRRRRGGRDRRERAPADRNTHWAARGEQRECEEPDGQGETTTTLRAGQRSKRTI